MDMVYEEQIDELLQEIVNAAALIRNILKGTQGGNSVAKQLILSINSAADHFDSLCGLVVRFSEK
jgi:hypothetical protein